MDPDRAAALLATLSAEPSATGLYLDFDGTLAPIVGDPAAAVPHGGATDLLTALGDAGYRVVVVSGRPVSFLEGHLPPSVDVAGVYGLEWRRAGERGTHPEAAAFAEVVARVAAEAAQALPAGATVESKGLSLTLHWRQAPTAATAVEEWATAAADRHGLEARRARASVELHPPVDADKGRVVLDDAVGLVAAAYAGDDRGDLPAFDALDALAERGVATVRIAAASDEAPPELLERADVVVDGPSGLVDLLGRLLP